MRTRIVFLLVLALAAFQVSCRRQDAPGSKGRPVVVLLGLDGADWSLIDPLIAQGRLPLFKEMKETAAWGALRTITPAKSPVVWTTIATGKTRQKHGIDDFRRSKPNSKGKYPIVSSLDIREPLLWEMLEGRGRRSVLVNWYVSFPPQPFSGMNVSDYFADSVISRSPDREKHLLQSVFPPERAAGLVKGLDSDYRRALKRTGLPDYPALAEEIGDAGRLADLPVLHEIPDMVRREEVVTETAARLFRTEKFDLFAAYYKLPDEVQHIAYIALLEESFRRTMDLAARGGALPDDMAEKAHARIADVVCPVYQNLERILRGYFEAAGGRETYFIIVSDHGFSFFVRDGRVRYNHIGQEKAPDGILIVRGPGVKPGKIKLARVYDIAPTVLYLLGLPLDRGMDGKPLHRLFTFKRESGYVAYRKGKMKAQGDNSEAEERKLQELKALGYIN